MKIKTETVPRDVRYLTPGKIYEGEYVPPAFCKITDDEGETLMLFLPCCDYLDFAAWEVVESSGEEPATTKEALKRWKERWK